MIITKASLTLLTAIGLLAGCGPPKGIVADPLGMWDSHKERRRSEYLSANPNTKQVIAEKIKGGGLAIGMTEAEVIASWGEPCDINKLISKHGSVTQYVYGARRYGSCRPPYIYFQDGKMSAYSD